MRPWRRFSCGNKSTCTHRAFWTVFSYCFLNVSWCSPTNLSSQEWVEGFQGLDQTQETVRKARTEGSSPSAQAGTMSELQRLPWGNGGCSPKEVTSRAMHDPRGHVGSSFSWVAWAVQWIRGLRCLSSTVCFVEAQLATCRFIWILGERK